MITSIRTTLACAIIGKDVRLASLCWLEALRRSASLPEGDDVLVQDHTVSNSKGSAVYKLVMYKLPTDSTDGSPNA